MFPIKHFTTVVARKLGTASFSITETPPSLLPNFQLYVVIYQITLLKNE